MKYNKQAFTLVELIVVITILAILATVAFISFQGYAASSRDSVRLADIKNIEKGLSFYVLQDGKYPMPDNAIEITASGNVLNYQGYAGTQVLGSLDVHGGGVDPIDQTYYTYSVNASQNKYQILGFLENDTYAGLVKSSYAEGLADRIKYTKGHKLGIVLEDVTSTPIQLIGNNVDIHNTTDTYTIYMDENTNINGVGNKLFSYMYNVRTDLLQNKNLASLDDSLVGYWDMQTTYETGGNILLKDYSQYGNNGVCYNNSLPVDCGTSTGPQFDNGGMLFDGTDDLISILNNASLQISDEITIHTDFAWKGNSSEVGFITAKAWENYEIHTNGSSLENGLKFFAKHGCNFSSSSDLFETGVHNTITMTFGLNGDFKIYFNGNLIGSKSCTPGLLTDSSNFLIGSRPGNFYFNGSINEIKLFNKELSAAEVQQLSLLSN